MAKVKLSKAKTAIIIIAAIIFALLVAGGIYCVATDQSPATAIEAATAHQDKLVGKWQSQNRRDYPLMYFMMTEHMILICLQLIFQANIL